MTRALIVVVVIGLVVMTASMFVLRGEEDQRVVLRDVLPSDGYDAGTIYYRLKQAQRIAERRWNTRCPDGVELHREVLMPRETIAQAEWTKDSDGSIHDCVVTFNTARFPLLFTRLCGAMMHEYGHLAGVGHSKDPTSFMYPKLTNRNIPDACRRYSRPQ